MMMGYIIAVAATATIGEPERFFGLSDGASIRYAQSTDTGKALIRNLGAKALMNGPAMKWTYDGIDFSDGVNEMKVYRDLGFKFFEFRLGVDYAPRNKEGAIYRIAPDFGWDQILPGDNPPWDGVDPDIYDTLAFLAMDEVLNLPPQDRGGERKSVWPVLPDRWEEMINAALKDFFPYVGLGEKDSAIVIIQNEPDHLRWRMQEIYFLVYWDNGSPEMPERILYDAPVSHNGTHWVRITREEDADDVSRIQAILKFEFWLNRSSEPDEGLPPDFFKEITIMPRMSSPYQDVNITLSKQFRDSVLYYWWGAEDYVNKALIPCYQAIKSSSFAKQLKVAAPSWAFDLYWCYDPTYPDFPGHVLGRGTFDPDGPHKWPTTGAYFPSTFDNAEYPGLVQQMEDFFNAGGANYCDVIVYQISLKALLKEKKLPEGPFRWETMFEIKIPEPEDVVAEFRERIALFHEDRGITKPYLVLVEPGFGGALYFTYRRER